jgi:hypothetical protein
MDGHPVKITVSAFQLLDGCCAKEYPHLPYGYFVETFEAFALL